MVRGTSFPSCSIGAGRFLGVSRVVVVVVDSDEEEEEEEEDVGGVVVVVLYCLNSIAGFCFLW